MSILDTTIEPEIAARLCTLFLNTHASILQFPKQEKYLLGSRLESALIDATSYVYLAANEQKGFKTTPLMRALAQMGLATVLLRCAFTLKLISIGQYQRLGAEAEKLKVKN